MPLFQLLQDVAAFEIVAAKEGISPGARARATGWDSGRALPKAMG
jgi:hypothetical protein